MSKDGGTVIAFPLKRKKKPEIRYRAPPETSAEQQLRDIDAAIKGLLEIRRALKAVYKRNLGIAAKMCPIAFLWCHQPAAVVHFLLLMTIHHTR